MEQKARTVGALLLAAGLLLASCGSGESQDIAVETTAAPVEEAEFLAQRSPDVPALPFDDNPDPDQCGIPIQWGENGQAFLTGMWEGELIQEDVLLYDSHLRLNIKGSVPHGSEVKIVLFQENPVLDYYFVKFAGDEPQEGWIPEHFLSFDPVV